MPDSFGVGHHAEPEEGAVGGDGPMTVTGRCFSPGSSRSSQAATRHPEPQKTPDRAAAPWDPGFAVLWPHVLVACFVLTGELLGFDLGQSIASPSLASLQRPPPRAQPLMVRDDSREPRELILAFFSDSPDCGLGGPVPMSSKLSRDGMQRPVQAESAAWRDPSSRVSALFVLLGKRPAT
ncbi:hypothetical protein J1605_013443 [Eschrichtius robustus]|uniref:Uncharacterized protein n=1 Tax=Eschrichtius robustus TaxID=9764 RepID=A0AB34GFB5_ESCRO|nr:hypothetical protein J1605_013443 [Eschrichtius robustus]